MRTTVANPTASRAPDLVRRQFKASRPGQLHVADFTYVPLAVAGLAAIVAALLLSGFSLGAESLAGG